MESIASVLNIGYILLPGFLSVSLIRQLIERDLSIAAIIGISLIFSFYLRFRFLKGHLKQSVIIVVVFFNILLTIVCTLGNGINDIGIIGYPIIIGFSGIMLEQRNLAIASSLSLAGVIWLVAGSQFGLYEVVATPTGSAGDFLVSSLFVIMGGFVAFNLTNNMRTSLKSAQEEILTSKKDSISLEKEVKEKLEIIEEIHRTVINSLQHTQKLIDYKQETSTDLKSTYNGLKSKVLVIEVAHEILLAERSPIRLDIRYFTIKLLRRYEAFLKTPVFHLDAGQKSHYAPLDLVINFGICILELISKADRAPAQSLSVRLIIESGMVNFIIHEVKNDKNPAEGIVTNLLVRQLKGKIEMSKDKLYLSFKV